MSKRSASPRVATLKLARVDDAWSVTSEASDVDLRPTEPSAATTKPTFEPVPAGPKMRVMQSYSLSFKPKMEATININGNLPEVRFASSESSICITGDEFLQLANCRDAWPANPIFLTNTRLEPVADGSVRFARYAKMNQVTDVQPAQEQDFFPIAVFYLSKFAVDRLKLKLDVMSAHVFRLLESEPLINAMFDSIVKVYKLEYQRLVSLQPITNHFNELTRLVETHVPPSHIVKDFCFNTSGSRWNHYSLLSSTMAQKPYILSMLE